MPVILFAIFAGAIVGAFLTTAVIARLRGPAGRAQPPAQDASELGSRSHNGELAAANRRLSETVAELDLARREADAQRMRLETVNRAKSMFLANVSHELRTPLNAILGFSEIIQKEMFGAIQNARYRDYVCDIHNAATHLQSMINDILDLSKIEADKYELHPEWLDPTELLIEPLRMVRTRAGEGGLALLDEFDPVRPWLYADRRALKQMALNLLSNAIKSTAEGHVLLRVRLLETGEVAIEVEDTGCGIPAEHLERILQPFEQIDNSYTRRYPGTGLGLPLVNALVRLHDGVLDIVSEAGKGTRMALRFPAARVALNAKPTAISTEMREAG